MSRVCTLLHDAPKHTVCPKSLVHLYIYIIAIQNRLLGHKQTFIYLNIKIHLFSLSNQIQELKQYSKCL